MSCEINRNLSTIVDYKHGTILKTEENYAFVSKIEVRSRLVVGVKPDCLTRDLGLLVECPPWGVFLRDLSLYLREFR